MAVQHAYLYTQYGCSKSGQRLITSTHAVDNGMVLVMLMTVTMMMIITLLEILIISTKLVITMLMQLIR